MSLYNSQFLGHVAAAKKRLHNYTPTSESREQLYETLIELYHDMRNFGDDLGRYGKSVTRVLDKKVEFREAANHIGTTNEKYRQLDDATQAQELGLIEDTVEILDGVASKIKSAKGQKHHVVISFALALSSLLGLGYWGITNGFLRTTAQVTVPDYTSWPIAAIFLIILVIAGVLFFLNKRQKKHHHRAK